MSGVAALLHEVLAYKCAHVATDAEMHERARGAEWCDYERALRYNLDGAEKSALVELVATLKDLERCLGHVCGSNERLLCRGVHELTQRFIHQTMGAPTRKAVKYEKRALKTVLMQLRNLSADAGIAKEDIDRLLDEEVIKSKWFKHSENLGYPARAVPPSQTQLWLMRATARALYDERSPHIKGGMMHEAPLSKEIIKEMSAFVSASACFPYLLRLSSTLQELGDVSVLWMREFFLELSQRVQFPISMSLPSILCNHVLANGNSHLLPRLLYTFEAYSDGARRALQTHRQQHLLVEIEAETNLVFDQVL
jgi:cytoplasmic FMR1 interacting protein